MNRDVEPPGETVVVTGGGGFLGSHLVPSLRASRRTVRVVDVAPPAPWLESLGVEVARVDVSDRAAMASVMDGAAVVVHAAFASPSATPERLREVNIAGTRAVCSAAVAAGVRQLIVVSSTIVAAPPRRHPFLASAPLSRLDAYRTTRAQAEHDALAAAAPGLRVAVVRPKTFVGPGRVGGFALVFDLIHRGRRIPITGPGTNRYQLLDIRDFARGLVALVERGGDGLFGFGASRFASIAEDLSALIDHAGTGSRLLPLPEPLGRVVVRGVELGGLAPLAEWHHCTATGLDSVIDTTRALDELGWVPLRSNSEALIDSFRSWSTGLGAGDEVATTHPVPRSHRSLTGVARRVFR